jgi:hypothetical protein
MCRLFCLRAPYAVWKYLEVILPLTHCCFGLGAKYAVLSDPYDLLDLLDLIAG